MSPKALLLDVMDTLVVDPFYEVIPGFFGTDLEGLFAIKSYDAWVAFECGQIDEATYQRDTFLDGRAYDLAAMKQLMIDGYRFIDGVEALLVDLKGAGIPMIAVSNYPCWWRSIEDKLELSRFLRWDSVSCITGVRKPDPEAYLTGARALGVEPEACVFVDDRQKNIDAAVALGMTGHRFSTAARFREWLEELELL